MANSMVLPTQLAKQLGINIVSPESSEKDNMSCIGDLDSIDGDTSQQIDPAAQKLKLQKDIHRYQQ
eukprot:12428807-Karenia_brevis.AAC.1